MTERSTCHPVRPARPAEEPAIRQLQALLSEPSPELLTYGLSTGSVLVTLASEITPESSSLDAVSKSSPPSSATAEVARHADGGAGRTRPVGYLLAIRGTETHLAEIAVDPEFRREGRASALLSRLLAERPPDERVTLTVAADNEAAQSLYRSFGFEHVDTDDALFEGGEALVFARRGAGNPEGEHGTRQSY